MRQTRPLLRLSVASLLLACAPKPAAPETLVERSAKVDWTAAPALPAPESGTWGRAPGVPTDVGVAMLVEGRRWDAALGGAAAAVALDTTEEPQALQRWTLRDALWRAGWLYPVHAASAWTTNARTPPPEGVFGWIERQDPGDTLGLVRARGDRVEAWVGLASRPRVDLGTVPRTAPSGTPLRLPAIAGGRIRVADGRGQVTEGAMDRGASVLLTVAGEWMFELEDAQGLVARFSVWVGRDAPDWSPFALPAQSVDGADALERRAYDLLGEVRRYYEKKAWVVDPLLGNVLDAPDVDAAMRGLGLDPSVASRFSCRAATVEDCLDGWVWSLGARRLVLGEGAASVGVTVALDTEGVAVRGVLVGE